MFQSNHLKAHFLGIALSHLEDPDLFHHRPSELLASFLIVSNSWISLTALHTSLVYRETTMSCQRLTLCRPTPKATTSLLQQSEKQFMKSDESAFSIVPSRMSSRLSMSTDQSTGHRDSISSYTSMVYRQLSFEDDLFTARVYKRNYRSLRLQRFWKQRPINSHQTITSRDEKSKIVWSDFLSPRPSMTSIDNSSSRDVNTKGKSLEPGHATDSHNSGMPSKRNDQEQIIVSPLDVL